MHESAEDQAHFHGIFRTVSKMLAKDWIFDKSAKPDREKVDSSYINIFGERWWCRVIEVEGEFQLVVWGVDVEGAATTIRGGAVQVFPWVMHEGEKLWLKANLWRLEEMRKTAALRREQESKGARR